MLNYQRVISSVSGNAFPRKASRSAAPPTPRRPRAWPWPAVWMRRPWHGKVSRKPPRPGIWWDLEFGFFRRFEKMSRKETTMWIWGSGSQIWDIWLEVVFRAPEHDSITVPTVEIFLGNMRMRLGVWIGICLSICLSISLSLSIYM